jgi:hypothetical protein
LSPRRRSGRASSGAGVAVVPFDDETLRIAVRLWLHDPARAQLQYGHISDWNTSRVRDMSLLFSKARDFNQPLPWDTSNVETMDSMFLEATSFNQPLPWDTSNVRNMREMFHLATAFNQPLRWDTSKVETMVAMFCGATSFNQPLPWETSNVRRMEAMFLGAASFNQPLRWDTSNVENTSLMFLNADLMLARYPDGIIPPPIDRWEQVRKKFMRDRRRWSWQAPCEVDRDVPLDVQRGWADEFGIPLNDPDTQRPKTKRALCADLARWWDAQREEQRAVSPTCHNPTGILGENVADIPPEFFHHLTHDDGLVYCDDIRSLHKHVKLSHSPQNPYNRQPYSTALVEDINASYDRLKRRSVHLDDFVDKDEPVYVPFAARFSQKLADLMSRLYHPVGPERLRGASEEVWAGFLTALVEVNVLSPNERAQVDAQRDLDQQKYFLVEFLARKIDQDPRQLQTEQGVISQLAYWTTSVLNRIFG